MITLNHCPDWIFDVVASAVAVEFLSSPLSLASVTQRFIKGMAEVYDEIETDRLMAVSENMILFLNEAEVGEASVDVLNSFCFFRIKFQMDKSPRKLGGLFGSAIKGEKVQNHDIAKSIKRFKAFLFALKNWDNLVLLVIMKLLIKLTFYQTTKVSEIYALLLPS